MASVGAGQAGQDRRRPAAARIADKQRILSIQHHAFHLSFADVVVDRHRAIGTEDAQRIPLTEGIVHRLGHGMLGQQLLLPDEELISQCS